MTSISNRLAAFSSGGINPVTAIFFMFFLYAAPGVRMGALSHLQVIHIATHKSIREGQNSPAHQPIELDSLFRAMPKIKRADVLQCGYAVIEKDNAQVTLISCRSEVQFACA
jgi:dihydroxyacetone synthase